jgi:hypothetical protein
MVMAQAAKLGEFVIAPGGLPDISLAAKLARHGAIGGVIAIALGRHEHGNTDGLSLHT